METDVRQGKPSASNAERWANCPGSFKLEKLSPGTGSEATDEGELLHAVMADHHKDGIREAIAKRDLSPDQEDAALRAAWQFDQIMAAYAGPDGQEHIEERFWLANESFSGQLDYAWVSPSGEQGVIVDFKFGRGRVDAAKENYQLLAYAVLLKTIYRHLETVTVVVIQPRSMDTVSCEISRGQMLWARIMLEKQAKLATEGTGDRRPGKWCKYCTAAKNCPEGQGYALALAQQEGLASPKDIGEILRRCDLAEALIKEMREKARDMLIEDPDAVEGWKVQEGKPSLTVLKSQERIRTGLKGKALDEHMNRLLEGTVEVKEIKSNRRNLTEVETLHERLRQAGYSETEYRKLGAKLTAG